jgi:glycosyltransferase involved in cell wall biosynthesis
MKIGILIDRLNVGGVEKIAIEQVKALREISEDAVLVVLRRKAVVEGAFNDILKDVPIEYLDDRLPRWLRFSFNFPIFYFFASFHLTYPLLIPWVVKKREFDYLVCHGTYTAFSAITIRKFRKVPFSCFIWDPIGYILKRVYREKFPRPVFSILITIANVLDRMILKNADSILVGGDAHNRHLQELKRDVTINEIPPSVHPLQNIPTKKDYVLMVTAWKEGKYPEYIFDLLERIPTMRVKMVGKWLEEDFLHRFEKSAEARGLRENIDIVGAVSENELKRYYAEALVLLQTNDDKGFGMLALEAAGHGTTFVIPEGQGVCKLFHDGIDGFYTKEKDSDTIAHHLKELISDHSKAERMGKHALEIVQKNYSWRKHAKALQLIIQECLKHNR